MIKKAYITLIGILLSLLATESYAQHPRYVERLPQSRMYVGDNTLQLDITTLERPYSYTFPNLLARSDRLLEQFILTIPSIEPNATDPTVLKGLTDEERALLARMVRFNRPNPIIIRIFFPDSPLDLTKFNGQVLTLKSEIAMGDMIYETLAQVQGVYRDDQLVFGFSLAINNVIMGIPRQAIEEIQLYASGIRVAGLGNIRQ